MIQNVIQKLAAMFLFFLHIERIWDAPNPKTKTGRKSARQAESRGLLMDAFACYRRGLQHLIRVLPVLDSGEPRGDMW